MSRSRVVVVAVVIGVVAVGGTIAYAVSSSNDNGSLPPVSFAPVDTIQDQAPTRADVTSAIADAVHGVDPGLFDLVTVTDPPAGEERAGTWLSGEAHVAGDMTEMEATWEFDLVQGAVAESLATTANLSSGIAGYKLRIVDPSGAVTDVTGGAGDIVAGQQFSGATLPDADVTHAIDATLNEFSLDPIDVRVLHPLGRAVRIVASIDDPALLAGRAEELRAALVGDPPAYEGLYLRILDADGAPLIEMSTAYRSGAGRLWIRPGLGIDLGTAHG